MNTPVSPFRIRLYQFFLLCAVFGAWHLLTATEILPPFFFGRPIQVFADIWRWFASGKIYVHLGVTLVETGLAFTAGTLLGLAVGLWLALSATASVAGQRRRCGVPGALLDLACHHMPQNAGH